MSTILTYGHFSHPKNEKIKKKLLSLYRRTEVF